MEDTASLVATESTVGCSTDQTIAPPEVPAYLRETYWWAYLHPRAVKIFEHQWIVNSILWGNFARLRDSALDEIGQTISGRTLQVACVYGDFTPKLAQRLTPGARLDVLDVAPIQLENLRRKIGRTSNVFADRQNAATLSFADALFDQVVVFFLLHELPAQVRADAVAEVMRVIKPGGKVVFVDYHRPVWQHPHRYLMKPILKTLEPFALDLWDTEIADWVPDEALPGGIEKETYFGGLYQKVVMTR
jgi:ubiquinone/menaquinone biosynthesis C-methylase UbiE